MSGSGTERNVENRFSKAKEILEKHKNIMGVKLGTHHPADIEPYYVQLKPNAKPLRSAQRRYGPSQQGLIESTITKMESHKAV